MALTLLRHTTPDVLPGTCYGRTDLALADSFEAELAALLSNLPRVRQIVTSPLRRCHLLASRIATEWDVPCVANADWIEMDFGRWEGIGWSAIPRAELDGWAADFMHYADHGGESVAMLEARVRAALAALEANTLVVTHAGCIKAACALQGLHAGWETETGFGQTVALQA